MITVQFYSYTFFDSIRMFSVMVSNCHSLK